MKVSDLEGALLDYWVGKSEYINVSIGSGHCWYGFVNVSLGSATYYEPSRHWHIGGPIIEREGISVHHLGVIMLRDGKACVWSATNQYAGG